ncbi:50S ribosomal protein L25 [Oscillospiraceae bacterium Marseille-Q3528]|nr:50S ribosomal protein L25 [Oscillospiraceae bacterium Marseille-Q3528]WNV59345.1 50S ribosomal protein L25 [Oscillospiraceae bacterium NTUH-002-81]
MNTLKAEKRDLAVKAKRLRREGYVTGNIFGREVKGSIPIKIERKDVDRLLKTDNKGSQIMLDVEGTMYDVLIKDVEFNPLAGKVDEIDFQALVSNEEVHSTAEVILLNHEKIVEGVLQLEMEEVAYKALPAALVDKVKIDVAEMKIGDAVKVKDLPLASAAGITLISDPEAVVVRVTPVRGGEVPEEAEEEAAE